ncbi:MAG: AAA family ATPase [Desulfovibrio sp.]|jgi:BioD-like phosphotransacetylase family protein|nr:AAA family ATPase [Desulfovibrio sp.]
MSNGIYIGSTTNRAGKSLLTLSLGLLLQKAGFSVAYMKPVGGLPQKKDDLIGDADALVVQELLGQDTAPDILSPVMLPEKFQSLNPNRDQSQSLGRIKEAYELISKGKDLCLVSGTGVFPWSGYGVGADGLAVLGALKLKVLLVERFRRKINPDRLLWLKECLGPNLLGIVLNDVPDEEMRLVSGDLRPWLLARGIPVFGVIGHEPELESIRVIDLAYGLKARIVAGNEGADSQVTSFFVGAMQPENFMLSLKRQTDCAVIVDGDRPDMQLLALYSNAPCVILSNDIPPLEMIRARAEEKNITLICAREDCFRVARKLAALMKSKKIRDLKQVRAGVQLLENSLDFRCILDKIMTN